MCVCIALSIRVSNDCEQEPASSNPEDRALRRRYDNEVLLAGNEALVKGRFALDSTKIGPPWPSHDRYTGHGYLGHVVHVETMDMSHDISRTFQIVSRNRLGVSVVSKRLHVNLYTALKPYRTSDRRVWSPAVGGPRFIVSHVSAPRARTHASYAAKLGS